MRQDSVHTPNELHGISGMQYNPSNGTYTLVMIAMDVLEALWRSEISCFDANPSMMFVIAVVIINVGMTRSSAPGIGGVIPAESDLGKLKTEEKRFATKRA